MGYQKQTWTDNVSVANAERLTHMEDGIGRYSAFLDVDGEFGGGWDGVIAAVNEAEARMEAGGGSACVMLGRGTYTATSTITFTSPITLMGAGRRQTRIKHGPGFTGYIFQMFSGRRNGMWEGSSGSAPNPVYTFADDNGGLELRDFAIIDDDRNTNDRGGIWLAWVDDANLHNITFGYLTGTALKLGLYTGDVGPAPDGTVIPTGTGRVRESDFSDINIYRCGRDATIDGADVPAFLYQSADGSGDGMNQNYFHRLRFVFNEGRWLMRSRIGSGGFTRRTIFRDTQLHCLYDASWSPAWRNTGDIVTLEGKVGSTIFDTIIANANQTGTALFRLKEGFTGEYPNRFVLKGVSTVNVDGDLVNVTAGQNVSIDGELQDIGGKVMANTFSDIGTYYVNGYGQSNPSGKVDTLYGSGAVLFNGVTQ